MAVNRDAFEKAKYKIMDELDIPTYYNEMISDKTNLLAQTLIPCPLHDERTASFKYFNETESFYCFGCERTGSVIDLHYHYMQRDDENYSITRSILDIAKEFNINIPNIFDDTFIDTENLFKYDAPVSSQGKYKGSQYTVKWLIKEIEKELKKIKIRDKNRYIMKCNEVDKIIMLDTDTRNKLVKILEQIEA